MTTWSPKLPWFPSIGHEIAIEGGKAAVEDSVSDWFTVRVSSRLSNALVTFRRETWAGSTGEQRAPWFERVLREALRRCAERDERMLKKLAEDKDALMSLGDSK